jgi:APA family basic amino acid/polyamine antiporter
VSWKNIFARKDLDVLLAEMAGEHRLRRVLGPVALTSLGVGAIIGAGIFALTGVAAANNAGPAVMVSFAVAAVGCVFAALCYAEFASMAPVAGSVYAYTYTTLGELFAWIIGWDLILEYSMGCAAVASSWSGYLNKLLGALGWWKVPERLITDPFSTVPDTAVHGIVNLPAIFIMLVVTAVLVLGIRESARTNAVLVMIKLCVVLFVIGMGAACVDPANWHSIPVAQRVLPEERLIPKLVGELLKEQSGGELDEQRHAALTRFALASYRRQWQRQEVGRLYEAGRLDDAARRGELAELDAQAAAAARPAPADAQLVAQVIVAAQAEAEKKVAHSWGLLGMIGLNRWLTPVDDATRNPFAPYGFSGIMLGAAIVFFAFIGFDSISTHAEEARNPQRDVPIGIITSLVLCTVLYVAVAAVVTGMAPYPKIDIQAPIAAAFAERAAAEGSTALRVSTALIAAGGLAGMTSVLLVLFLSQARVFMAMARDGLLPPVFGTVHPRFRTPHLATMLTGVVICAVAALTPILKIAEMVNIGTLMAFVMVCAAVLILRVRRPEVQRPFRCPAVGLIAPLGVMTNLVLMLFLPMDTWLRLVIWLAIGFLVYFCYSRRHSVLGNHLARQLRSEGVAPTDAPLDSVGD